MKVVMSVILGHLRPAVALVAVFTLLLGVLYPAAVETVVRHSFTLQIEDGIVRDRSGHVLATAFSGPAEDRPQYVWGRIYGADTLGCDAFDTTPRPARCQRAVAARVAALHAADPEAGPAIPADLLMLTSSNLQPDISLAAAQYQAHRVAVSRHIAQQQVDAVIDAATHNAIYNTTQGLYVNVLEVNLRLDGKLA